MTDPDDIQSILDEIEIHPYEEEALPICEPPLRRGRYRIHGRPEDADVVVLCAQSAILAVQKHARDQASKEVAGMLLGRAFMHEGRTYIEITEYIKGRPRSTHQSSVNHIQISDEMWAEMYRVKDQRYPDLAVVGWFHSHPGHGIFLSEDDKPIQRHHFPRLWHTAMVFDPLAHEGGFFIWAGSDLIRAPGFYELYDEGREASIVRWRNLDARSRSKTVPAPNSRIIGAPTWVALLLVGLVLIAWLGFLTWKLIELDQSVDGLRVGMEMQNQELQMRISTLEAEQRKLANLQLPRLQEETRQLQEAIDQLREEQDELQADVVALQAALPAPPTATGTPISSSVPPTVTVGVTLTVTGTPTVTVMPAYAPTPTATVPATVTPSLSLSPTQTVTLTPTQAAILTPTQTVTLTPTLTVALTPTPTMTLTPTLTVTANPSPSSEP